MALTLKQVIENCRKFNMNSGVGKEEMDKIHDILFACKFDTLRKTDNMFLMALEKGHKVWLVECRITKDYNMFKDWQSDKDGSGYVGLLNLSKKVWGYKKNPNAEVVTQTRNVGYPYWFNDTLFTSEDTCFVRDCRIDVLNLSVRSYNVLMRSDITTVGQLYNLLLDVNSVMRVRNMGSRSARELYERLNMAIPSEIAINPVIMA